MPCTSAAGGSTPEVSQIAGRAVVTGKTGTGQKVPDVAYAQIAINRHIGQILDGA
jgi:hypothetical protein